MRASFPLRLALVLPSLFLHAGASAIHLPVDTSGASGLAAAPISIELPSAPSPDAKNADLKRRLAPAKLFPHQEIRDSAVRKAFETLERTRSLQRQHATALRNGALPGGYQGAAASLRSCADELLAEVENLEDQQRKISDYSYNLRPGATSEDARGFRLANRDGRARITGYKAQDALVSEQADQYDQLGRAANEIEKEARRYERRAGELEDYARRVAQSEDPESRAASAPLRKETAVLTMASFSTAKLEVPSLPEPGSTQAPGEAPPPSPAAESSPPPEWSAGAGVKAAVSANPYHGSGKSLREELRARLREHYGHEPSEHELDQGERAALAAEQGSVPEVPGAPPSDDPVDTFTKGLGTPAISLAGSETDASVRAMFRQIAGNEPAAQPVRAPASLQGADVGAEEGPTLFERAHATHRRCEQRGCVNWRVAAVRGGG